MAVIDAKYKRLGGRSGVDREDLYQLHAYSSTFDAPVAALTYPAITDAMPTDEHLSPWQTSSGGLSFLTLPTEKTACVAKLTRWIGQSHPEF